MRFYFDISNNWIWYIWWITLNSILFIVLQTKVCNFVVFDQSWTKTRELTSDHCSSGHHRNAFAGGMSHADTTSTQFQDAMSYVASQVDLQSNGLFRSSPVHYSHCFQQVSTLSWYQWLDEAQNNTLSFYWQYSIFNSKSGTSCAQ